MFDVIPDQNISRLTSSDYITSDGGCGVRLVNCDDPMLIIYSTRTIVDNSAIDGGFIEPYDTTLGKAVNLEGYEFAFLVEEAPNHGEVSEQVTVTFVSPNCESAPSFVPLGCGTKCNSNYNTSDVDIIISGMTDACAPCATHNGAVDGSVTFQSIALGCQWASSRVFQQGWFDTLWRDFRVDVVLNYYTGAQPVFLCQDPPNGTGQVQIDVEAGDALMWVTLSAENGSAPCYGSFDGLWYAIVTDDFVCSEGHPVGSATLTNCQFGRAGQFKETTLCGLGPITITFV